MLAENLFENSGFCTKYSDEYYKYKEILGDFLDSYVEEYTSRKITMRETLDKLNAVSIPDVHTYTLHLMFILECTSYLLDKYRAEGIDDKHFYDSMRDIPCKIEECMNIHGIFGTFVAEWYGGFIHNGRMGFGRLQFDRRIYEGEPLILQGYTVEPGEFILGCHIPSMGPLHHKLCMDSYKQAYEFYRDRLRAGVLPIFCESWLLYPGYVPLFGEKSNTLEFIRDFQIYKTENAEVFKDCWRVFGTDYKGDVSPLPDNTGLQKRFRAYIKDGGAFGYGFGVILFDGEKVIKNKEV